MYKLLLVVLLIHFHCSYGAPKDIFRFKSEDGKQFHYMSGQPGQDVEGSFGYYSPDGDEFKLLYKANKFGYQPVGNHLPESVQDTDEVTEAKAKFRSTFDEVKEKLDKLEEEKVEEDAKDIIEEQDNKINMERKKRQVVSPTYYYQIPQKYFVPAVDNKRKDMEKSDKAPLEQNAVHHVSNVPSNHIFYHHLTHPLITNSFRQHPVSYYPYAYPSVKDMTNKKAMAVMDPEESMKDISEQSGEMEREALKYYYFPSYPAVPNYHPLHLASYPSGEPIRTAPEPMEDQKEMEVMDKESDYSVNIKKNMEEMKHQKHHMKVQYYKPYYTYHQYHPMVVPSYPVLNHAAPNHHVQVKSEVKYKDMEEMDMDMDKQDLLKPIEQVQYVPIQIPFRVVPQLTSILPGGHQVIPISNPMMDEDQEESNSIVPYIPEANEPGAITA